MFIFALLIAGGVALGILATIVVMVAGAIALGISFGISYGFSTVTALAVRARRLKISDPDDRDESEIS